MNEPANTPASFVHLPTLRRVICCACLRELSMRAARFHRLCCKTKAVSRAVIDGEEQKQK